MNWYERAACRGVDQSVFFPDVAPGDSSAGPYARAKTYCAVCPVVQDCLAYVLPFEEITRGRHGCWAGMTPKERDRYVKNPRQ